MKDKLLKKIVKKNYNNQLEEVLAKKKYTSEVKNELLSMFYKIENGYNDYKTIKRQTFEKDEYIEKLISIIEKNCNKIEFTKNQDEQKIDIKAKQIICYPIETNILYSIAKMSKKNIVVKYLDKNIEEALTFVLNIGNNINIVEPLRDFNGFSWNVIVKDIEDVKCNLIYQNIIYLFGNKLVDKWVNTYDPLVDYFDLFQEEIKQKYGDEIEEKIRKDIIEISILIKASYDEDFKARVKNSYEDAENRFNELENTTKYITKISRYKKTLETKIKNIDRIINSKRLLSKEYEKKNEKLPLEKKIFSQRVLKNMLMEERENLIKEIEDLNKSIEPRYFLEEKNKVKAKLEFFSVINNSQISNKIIDLQKQIIKCMYIDTKNTETKQEMVEQIYMYRYFCLLPLNNNKRICEKDELNSYLEKFAKLIIDKALEMKVINKICNIDAENYEITKKLFLSKIISLQDINLKLNYKDGAIILTVYDEKIEDDEIKLENITKENLNCKLNKKIKLFN